MESAAGAWALALPLRASLLISISQSINVGLSSAVCAVLVFIAQVYPSDRVLGITGKNVPWAYAGTCCSLAPCAVTRPAPARV
jgi:hypothetical protein